MNARRRLLVLTLSASAVVALGACETPQCPDSAYRYDPGPPRACISPDGGIIYLDIDAASGEDAGMFGGDGGHDAATPPDACSLATYYRDQDMDGFGDPSASMEACSAPSGYVANADDCDDDCADCHPGGTEVCDAEARDENCMGGGNEGCDCASDPPRACPGGTDVGECSAGTQMCVGGVWGACVGGVGPMTETCNGLDDDCDTVIDGPVASASCTPTSHVTSAGCTAGACTALTCESGWDDCDDGFANGCETPLTTTSDCGACGTSCGWVCGGASCADAVQIESGGAYSCARLASGQAVCWGYGSLGQLGTGAPATVVTTPSYVMRPDGLGRLEGLVDIAVGFEFACGVVTAGNVYCWGANGSGQLGRGSTSPSTLPVAVLTSVGGPALTSITEIAAGRSHACARNTTGRVYCWGNNSSGQLGNNAMSPSTFAVQVSTTTGTLLNVTSLALGQDHSCARTSAGNVYCWGGNGSGQIGDGTMSMRLRAVQVLAPSGTGALANVTAIAAGTRFTCARTSDGAIRCWGSNSSGQLGRTGTASSLPIAVLTDADVALTGTEVWAAFEGGCAFASDGLRCWGNNMEQRLGIGTFASPVFRATRVLGLGGAGTFFGEALSVGPGEDHACAVRPDGSVACWGANDNGQLAVLGAGPRDPLLASPPPP